MVKTGGEDTFIKQAQKVTEQIDPSIKFYFFKRKMIEGGKKAGQMVDHPLFPGYVFMLGPDMYDDLYLKIKQVKNFGHFLNNNHDIQPLRGKDLDYLSILSQNGSIAGISKAMFDENDRIQIIEGPLAGFRGNIIKVDKRKRRVTVFIDLCGTSKTFDLSYEIVQKDSNSSSSKESSSLS